MESSCSMSDSNSSSLNANLNYYAQSLTYSLTELKHVFDNKDNLEATRVAAYEKLAETTKIMRVILEKYSLIKSKELLLNASNLVQAVKTFDYDNYSTDCNSKLVDAINKLYISFHSSLSNYVMEDIVTMASADSKTSQFAPCHTYKQLDKLPVNQAITQQQIVKLPNHQSTTVQPQAQYHLNVDIPEERVLANDSGLDKSLIQAKAWSKYVKEMILYIEKRVQVEIEYNRNIIKNAQGLKSSIFNFNNEKTFLPFHNVYHQFLMKEIENANISIENFDLLTRNLLNPLNEYRLEYDKQLKKIKEDWSRENKQMVDAKNNMAKSRDLYISKKQDLEKLQFYLKSSENTPEWANSEKIEKKRRTSEEAAIRTSEAEDNYTKSVLACQSQTVHNKKIKRDNILKIRDLLSIMEIKVKEITSHYFETLRDSMTYSPSQINEAIDNTSRYETGKSYKDFANSLPLRSVNSNISKSLSLNHYKASTSHFLDIDSSESDNNSTLSIRTQNHKSINRKDSSPSLDLSAKNFEVNIEKSKYSRNRKVNYEEYAVTPHIEVNFHQDSTRLFGVPLSTLSVHGSVPDIVKQCIKQIELRGAQINGIYRVSGVKSKVESVCRDFEENPSNVNLSSVSPNIIANVLKHFFRELPEPLMTFQLYPEFIKVARKFSTNHTVEESEDIVSHLKKIVSKLPQIHYNTLKYLMRHLRQISHNCAVNNMPPSNLGIVFGPTLLKKNNEVNASVSTLFDTNHQSRIIELLIIYSNEVFDIFDDEDKCDKSYRQGSFTRNDVGHVKSDIKCLNKQHPLSDDRQSLGSENSFRIYKSATCSSIMNPENNTQSKQHIVEARRQFFNSDFNAQSQMAFPQRYKPSSYLPTNVSTTVTKSYKVEDGLSPFSQITASSSTSSPTNFLNNQNRIKRFTPNYHQISNQVDKNRIYHKHNELSKSSSDLYSFKNSNMTVTSNNEDVV